jgi:NAD(P)-dependent dehydrogenase (short-subunit alcohol dehydrogenase family)
MNEFTAQASLKSKEVLVIGGARYLGAAIARRAAESGAHVIIGGRDLDLARSQARKLPGADAVRLDLSQESTIQEAARSLGAVDHIVSTASAPHNVPVSELEHDRIVGAFEAKVFGPMLVAKHFAPNLSDGGSITLFSGIAAWKPATGFAVMDVTNGAVQFLTSHLAVELAPVRVNAISPGITDSGTWDALSETEKEELMSSVSRKSLVRRVGHIEDIVDATLWLMTAGFVTGETIHVEGGARHV